MLHVLFATNESEALTPRLAALSVGLKTEDIIAVLNRLSKIDLPSSIETFIRECTLSYGKVKLVLQRNRYFIESSDASALQALLKDSVISGARVKASDASSDPNTGLISTRGPGKVLISGGVQPGFSSIDPLLRHDDLTARMQHDDDEDDRTDSTQQDVHAFEIDPTQVEHVKRRCVELDYPTLEEYDFRNDTTNPNLEIDLKPTSTLRPYQEKSLSKMFGNGRARSGLIVLPCGAGKSLVGVTAACTVKKSCLCLCTSSVSVEQWKYQFRLWSTIDDKSIAKFTSDQKELFSSVAGVTVTTYTMVAFGGRRSKESLKIMEEIQNREWGLVLLDEVHVVPAQMFRKVLTVVKAHCKLGLTATLVREDDLIADLNFLIGPKLYEANWIDLQRAGHIANVQCVEVWCGMAAEFYREYLCTESRGRRSLLYVMNPTKFRNCQFLINFHEQRGDKIIVFSDNIFALIAYARKLKRPYIYGPTSSVERMRILSQFQHNPQVRTIFISRVGDNSIDLPEANVIIQVASHYGSRRQEAQRLGRILRPKARTDDQFNAYFYSLVSQDTEEMYYSTKLQQFLIDQGYAFKVITELPSKDDTSLCYSSREDQLELLAQVLAADESEGREEQLEEDFDDLYRTSTRPSAQRFTGSARMLSGGESVSYSERGGQVRFGSAFQSDEGGPSRPMSIFSRPMARHKIFNKFRKSDGRNKGEGRVCVCVRERECVWVCVCV